MNLNLATDATLQLFLLYDFKTIRLFFFIKIVCSRTLNFLNLPRDFNTSGNLRPDCLTNPDNFRQLNLLSARPYFKLINRAKAFLILEMSHI